MREPAKPCARNLAPVFDSGNPLILALRQPKTARVLRAKFAVRRRSKIFAGEIR
jgi:hypothetical protein